MRLKKTITRNADDKPANDCSELAGLVQAGQSIYVTGGLTPPMAFVEALQADRECTSGLRITTTVAPGFPNPFDFERLHRSALVTGPLMRPDLTAAQREGRFSALPVTFTGYLRHLETQSFDFGVVQVAPPDSDGRRSLGPSVEFWPAALKRCRRVIAMVNPLLPALPYAASLSVDRIDAMCEASLVFHRQQQRLHLIAKSRVRPQPSHQLFVAQ